MQIDVLKPGTVPAELQKRRQPPRERRGVDLRGMPVPPSDVDVQMFLTDIADIARRLAGRCE